LLQYRQVAFRPYVHSPALGQKKVMAQTFDSIMGWSPLAGDIIRLTFHGIATYLGIWVGLNGHKVKGGNRTVRIATIGLGWALAGGQGLGAIADIVSLIKRATGTHPPDEPSPPVSATAPIPPVR
jgi:hypothetical protein